MPIEQNQIKQFKSVQEWEQSFFKKPNSRKEKLTYTYTHTVVWLMEDGKKVKELNNQRSSNTITDILFHGEAKDFDDYTDKQAVKYAEDTIISYHENMPESYGSEELWQEMINNFLKAQAMNYTSKYLEYLKGQEMNWCVKLADLLLGKLSNILMTLYKQSDEKQRKIFKERMESKFPNSQILKEIQ